MIVLIIGLGSIAKKHIQALNKIFLNPKIYALRSSLKASKEENVINIYSLENIKELNIDFVIISNPTYKHKETIIKLLHHRLPLFIEKPLFDKIGEEEKILNSINENNTPTYVACNLRFLHCLQYIKNELINKQVNEVNIYCGSYLPDWRPGQNFRDTYSANKNMGGGVHIDLIHEIDYATWIFGYPSEISSHFSSKSTLKISAIDYANYLFQYNQYNVNIVLNYFRRDSKRTLEVVCEDGTFNIDLLKNQVIWNGKIVFESNQNVADTYTDQLKFFIENIITRKCSFNSINEAYKILKICFMKE